MWRENWSSTTIRATAACDDPPHPLSSSPRDARSCSVPNRSLISLSYLRPSPNHIFCFAGSSAPSAPQLPNQKSRTCSISFKLAAKSVLSELKGRQERQNNDRTAETPRETENRRSGEAPPSYLPPQTGEGDNQN